MGGKPLSTNQSFVVGRDVAFVGRWFRLIVGLYFAALAIVVPFLREPVAAAETLTTLGTIAIYLVAIVVVYIAAFAVLGRHVLARANPWVGTILMLGPLIAVTALEIGPQPFRVAVGLYYSIASIFNFAMSYGGCEVVAIPSLIFRRRYTLYCPYNVVDAVETAMHATSRTSKVLAAVASVILVVVGGYFLLVEQMGLIRSVGVRVDVHNAWALLLLAPAAYLLHSTWVSYRQAGSKWSAMTRRLGLGTAVLIILTVMFVIGADANPLFAAAVLIGAAATLVRWVIRKIEAQKRDHAS